MIIFLSILLIITGCVNPNKPAPKSNPNLPVVKDFKAYPDRNAIALFWTPIPSMSGYYIQRFNPTTKKWEQITTINDPYKSIYVDTNLKPNHLYKYRIATFDKNHIPSLAKEISQKTLNKLSPVIILEAKALNGHKIKLIFRPHRNERVKEYIIERFNNKNAKWETIAKLYPRLNVEYIDNNLKEGTLYQYRVIAKSFDNITSIPSKIIKVSTFNRPPIVMNVKASTNLPKKIKLTFSPVKGAIAYKIYISSYPNGPFRFYKKITSTTFLDLIPKDGYIRYYKVTALSPHNTESLLDNSPVVMGETLPPPSKPIVSTNRNGNFIELILSSADNRAAKYLIVRKEKISMLKYKTKKFIVSSNKFVDKIDPKHSYIYEVYEVDKYGLISKNPSIIEVE